MSTTSLLKSSTPVLTNNTKVIALETSLNQSVVNFQDLILDLQQLQIDTENYRLQYLSLKEKCETKTCTAAEEFKKVIVAKDHIIQAVASTLTKLNETKDFNILREVFKILFDEVAPLTPPTDTSPKTHPPDNSNKADFPKNVNVTPCKAVSNVTEDGSFKEDSLCEIEGTPTGRTSPIIQTKKIRNILGKTEIRDNKKKCPDHWPKSESKAFKLIYPNASRSSPKGVRLRQSRLNLHALKTSTVVDLTCSPEILAQTQQKLTQPLIKKESMEDDTILPSPTSGPASLEFFKTTSKASPSKFRKPKPLSLKSRCEQVKQDENKDTSSNDTNADMDESINILNNFNRLRNIKKENSVPKNSPVKKGESTPIKKEQSTPIKKEQSTPAKKEMEPVNMEVQDEDVTNASIFLQDIEHLEEHRKTPHSSPKRPLAENINISNTPPRDRDPAPSTSPLRPEPAPAAAAVAVDAVRRKIPELVEPVYKEPAVRNKAEKRNLQGWSCEECMNFYGVLYKDDPVMLARKIQDCSKHRGQRDPVRPKTPPNFWNPRWTVPEDTEELNRMNNGG